MSSSRIEALNAEIADFRRILDFFLEERKVLCGYLEKLGLEITRAQEQIEQRENEIYSLSDSERKETVH